ncbi:MAG: hypothetical protein ACLPYS_12360, partial [Vulcanimicrobiaceae bacterium]
NRDYAMELGPYPLNDDHAECQSTFAGKVDELFEASTERQELVQKGPRPVGGFRLEPGLDT